MTQAQCDERIGRMRAALKTLEALLDMTHCQPEPLGLNFDAALHAVRNHSWLDFRHVPERRPARGWMGDRSGTPFGPAD
jgi:hypothetical protein